MHAFRIELSIAFNISILRDEIKKLSTAADTDFPNIS